MGPRERFWGAVRRTKIDRLPVVEWAPWWPETRDRWYGEGLPRKLTTQREICGWFGQDDWRMAWIRAVSAEAPKAEHYGRPLVRSRDDYEAFQKYLWPEPTVNLEELASWREDHDAGRCVVWVVLEGFFWFPRRLLGIENHLLAFYDQPELIKAINERLVEYHLHCLDLVAEVLQPDFVNFAEDMAYNHGPMISKKMFDEFIAPHYRRVVPRIHAMGAVTMMDSDGLMDPAIPWLLEVGLGGIEPLERQAGVDIVELRRRHPELKMLGAFDKMTMPRGREAMRAEFERILPVMASGGYIPACDHQTPPGVSLANYRVYLELLREYAVRAVEGW